MLYVNYVMHYYVTESSICGIADQVMYYLLLYRDEVRDLRARGICPCIVPTYYRSLTLDSIFMPLQHISSGSTIMRLQSNILDLAK